MTAIRYIEAPTRRPGETGRAFVERMLAQLSKGGATAPPPKVEITAKTVKVDKALTVEAKARPEDLGSTKSWPPLPGQRYSGAWRISGSSSCTTSIPLHVS